MNLQECWRSRIQEASPFEAKNHSLSSDRIKKELQGGRRLEPSAAESRVKRKKDKRILERVRRAIIDGDYGRITPQQIGKDMSYLLSRGYTGNDMLTKPTIEFPISTSIIEVAAAAD